MTTVSTDELKKVKEAAIREWNERQIDLARKCIDEGDDLRSVEILRCGVYDCDFGENIGDENSEFRPVVVLSNQLLNQTAGKVTVVPLTTTLKTKRYRGKEVPRYRSHYFLYKQVYPFLEDTSAAMGEEVRTVSKVRLGKKRGMIEEADVQQIIKKINWVFQG